MKPKVQPPAREQGEHVPPHAHVPHEGNADLCQFCGLACVDRAHPTERYRNAPTPTASAAGAVESNGGAGTGGPDSNGSSNGRKVYKKDAKTGRFRKGTAGGGAPYGNHNHPSRAIRERALEIITDSIYQDNLLLRARAGLLAPAMEVMLYHYAIGKPRETVEHQERPGFRIVFQGPRRDPLADGGDHAQRGAPPMLPPVSGDDGAEGGATGTPL